MPKLAPFADWKAPWETAGTEFNAELAKKRIYDLLSDKEVAAEKHTTEVAALTTKNTELQKAVDEVNSKNLTEAQRLEKEKKDLENKLTARETADEKLKVTRLELALEHGLTKAEAKRLVGSTEEELKADAITLLEEKGLYKDGKPVEKSTEEVSTSTRRTPRTAHNPLNPEGGGEGVSAEQLLKVLPRD
jgi:hypothetical protein